MSQEVRRPDRAALLVHAGVCAGALLVVVALWSHPEACSADEERALVRWLEERSMLYQAGRAAREVSGSGVQWRHPYGQPQPAEVVRRASVWLLDYPGSVIVRPGQSVLAAWGEPALWDALHEVGIDLLHTGPLNRAGGVEGRRFTPTLDGWFDRISLDLDPALGSEEEYLRMAAVAGRRGCLVAGDLVPLHTGTGPDFYLALRGYKDYPGMYTMVEIDRADWGLLPEVRGPWGVAHVPKPAAKQLARKGYIPGLINSCDAAPEARTWSGWSASGEVCGTDGKVRRWVYLHYFKPAQPVLNWLDPSFAGPRAIAGDVVRTVHDRRTRIVRLDAVPFLGIEPKPGSTESLHFKHPLSVAATEYLSFQIRKLGGWSFQELNVPLEELNRFTRHGPDLSYDFFTRAQCLHALLTGEAGPLRLAFRWLLDAGVPPGTLVHDLQNHDEITYQLVEPDHRGKETFRVGKEMLTGRQLRERMLEEMREKVAGRAAPYNRLYRPERDGVATTFAGFVAPALGVRDPYGATPEQVRLIREGHLLLAAANALQPGVFSLSSWDLAGALPVSGKAVQERTSDGDMRWVNRGGVDLLGANPQAGESAFGLPRAKALYGALPEQVKDPHSFASQLRELLTARKKTRIAEGELLAVPEPRAGALCVLALRLPGHPLALTVLNFSRKEVEEVIDLAALAKAARIEHRAGEWTDVRTGRSAGTASREGKLRLRIAGLYGTTCVPAGENR
jgi:maltose alpha-D-glucosyltransferase/alpha-amylase